jgi:hypothetical protein
MKNYILPLFLLPLCVSAQVKTDSSVSAGIINKFKNYEAAHQTEKVYLHFDRPYYAAGDTIFYKAYVTLGDLHRLSNLSGVLHTELIDNITGKIILSEKLPILSGVAWGDFALPDSLHNNNYRVRAYTRLMLNGSPDFFEQSIPVVAVTKPKSPINSNSNPMASGLKPDIQFFPEGGNLVDGINAKIAFKAIAPDGLGIPVSGQVVDNNNNVIASFKDQHLGMGDFNFTPVRGKTYFAKVKFAGGDETIVGLPKAEDSGIALSVDNRYPAIVAQVRIASDKNYFAGHKGQGYILSLYSNGQLTNITCALDSEVMLVNLYKWKMRSGITRLTLFSPSGEPMAERLMFVRGNDMLKLNVSSEKPVYAAREKVSFKLVTNDGKDHPVAGNFSVAVINENKAPVDTDSENTILNTLLLNTELKGNIEHPNYYFRADSQACSDLDVLLLTQGYRGFAWKSVLTDTGGTEQYQPELSLAISGTVKTPGGKVSPLNDVNLASMVPYLAMDTTADKDGKFTFNGINVIDTAKILLRAKGNRVIDIAPNKYPQVTKTPAVDTAKQKVAPAIVTEMTKQYQQRGNMRKGIVLKQVNIHAPKGLHPFDPKLLHSDNLNGPGEADKVLLADDYPWATSVGDLLGTIHFPPSFGLSNKPMVVILNGSMVPVNDPHIKPLDMVAISDIYSIEILSSPQYLTAYGSNASGGAIVITTRNGTERSNVNMQPGLTTYKFTGYYKARSFYSPKYDVKTPANSIPDTRTTVYWNPVLITDKDGNASFDFYNTDLPGNYRVVVEGIDGDGNLGRQVYNYMVK